MRHIILYSTDSGRPYVHNEILFHIITSTNKPLDEYIARAVLQFPGFRPRYAGEEILPVEVGEGEVAIKVRVGEQIEVTDVQEAGMIDHAALREFNSQNLKIDYDSSNFLRFAEAVHRHILPHISRFAVSKTVRGLHLRAELRQRLSFEEKVQLRRHLDDPERIGYDRLLASLGYESLTDTLFHRKIFLDDARRSYERYEEEWPVTVTRLDLPDLVFESELDVLQIGKVRFSNEERSRLLTVSTAEFSRPITAEDFIKHYDRFEEAFMQANIPVRLCRAYDKVHWRLPEAIMRLAEEGKIRIHKDRVEIDAGEFAGMLIGIGGRWVAQIEKELNTRLIIRGEAEHEERRMRLRKLDTVKDELMGHEGTNPAPSGVET